MAARAYALVEQREQHLNRHVAVYGLAPQIVYYQHIACKHHVERLAVLAHYAFAHSAEHAVGGQVAHAHAACVEPVGHAVEQERLAQPRVAGKQQVAAPVFREVVAVAQAYVARAQHVVALRVGHARQRLGGEDVGAEALEGVIPGHVQPRALAALLVQPRAEALAVVAVGVAHVAPVAAYGAAVAHLQIVLAQPQRAQAARYLAVYRVLLGAQGGLVGRAVERKRPGVGLGERLRAPPYQRGYLGVALAYLAYALVALVLLLAEQPVKFAPHGLSYVGGHWSSSPCIMSV